MKKSIMPFTVVGILFLLSFSTQAQSNDWTGKWNTTLLGNPLGELNITKSGDIYTGTFPNGKLDGKYENGNLTGTYTRTLNSFDRTGMGKMGLFTFIMHAGKKSFEGEYKPEGKDDWQPDNWNGTRPSSLYGNIIEEQAAKDILDKREQVLKDFANKDKPAPIKPWTGTWETDVLGKLKINQKNIANVLGKYRFQVNNKFTNGDITGKVTDSNRKEFEGHFKDSEGKSGQIKISYSYLVNATPGYDFSGVLIYDFTPEQKKMNIPLTKKVVSIKGHRVSSLLPNMVNYN
ncbi:hypothetical protein KO529_04625 [Arenibacter algicola]|uniref:hypothetical protein n=1 Tax=Arenibacter algicola TaxID=616991 RepID=UPI001C07EACD|nr:hypothetical protein [Arenibacter algicola]MBU2904061.1 hypothetical protein [Arenibacter algicola]